MGRGARFIPLVACRRPTARRLPECGRARHAKAPHTSTVPAPPPHRDARPLQAEPRTVRAVSTPRPRHAAHDALAAESRAGGVERSHRRLATARCCGSGLLVVPPDQGAPPVLRRVGAVGSGRAQALPPAPLPTFLPSLPLTPHPPTSLRCCTSAPLGAVPPGEAATTATVVAAAVRSVYLAARRRLSHLVFRTVTPFVRFPPPPPQQAVSPASSVPSPTSVLVISALPAAPARPRPPPS